MMTDEVMSASSPGRLWPGGRKKTGGALTWKVESEAAGGEGGSMDPKGEGGPLFSSDKEYKSRK